MEGVFAENGQLDIFGRIIYSNGDVYYGMVKNNKKHGHGTFTQSNGIVQKGFFN